MATILPRILLNHVTAATVGAELFLVLMLIGPFAQPTRASGQDELSRQCGEDLRPLVETTMAQRGVPGVIVFVSVPNVCEWTAALGVDDVVVGRPMRRNDHVRVGSITKTFTGTLVLQLVDEGLVVLDDPISRYLTRVPNGENITVRQLLNMTSGLYNYSDDLVFNTTLVPRGRRSAVGGTSYLVGRRWPGFVPDPLSEACDR